MPNLYRRLPNLASLAFFEAAGRHASFTRAAAELHVTQGAVSRQIRQLEAALGTPLFRRMHRAVELTRAGRRYHQAVSIALGHIADSTAEIAAAAPARRVTLAATLAVSTLWLMPRVAAIRERFPGLEVHLLSTDAELDRIRDDFDIGIRYGSGSWPGFHASLLARDEVLPVCSRDYARRRPLPRTPAGLRDHPLLMLDNVREHWIDWPTWLARMGVEGPGPNPALRVSTYHLLVEAAVAGQGIALGWRRLIGAYLASGALVPVTDAVLPTLEGYHLVVPSDRPGGEDVERLSRWIADAFAGGGPSSGAALPSP